MLPENVNDSLRVLVDLPKQFDEKGKYKSKDQVELKIHSSRDAKKVASDAVHGGEGFF